ncbi:hypothetical protein HU830_01580 [Lactobacillus sp. DCY120]|uniref:Uncharacterized protein n=1 Tax=Bombilactobacillus apium TaxID=2675299 RepID=A0A850R1J6_9LACO|nr:hypothetical protein [Bombilactobacillus apium]NVY95891.1 hypothetical protein [Bombilactobacillus apium]
MRVFDSYVPSNPIKSMSGEICIDNNMNDVRILKINFQNLLQWIVINRSLDTIFSELMKIRKIFVPWTELNDFVKGLSIKDARKMAYNLADSNIPATRMATVKIICEKTRKIDLLSNLTLWQQQWILLRVCLYKYSITQNILDRQEVQNVIEKLKEQDKYLLAYIGSEYYDSSKRNN